MAAPAWWFFALLQKQASHYLTKKLAVHWCRGYRVRDAESPLRGGTQMLACIFVISYVSQINTNTLIMLLLGA